MSKYVARGILPAVMAAGIGLGGCFSAAPTQQGSLENSAQQSVLQGRILTPERQVAALLSDVANGATVSLIDTATGNTVATTVSSADGAYGLYLPAAFSPVAGRPYYLEAMKGLASGGTANRAGAPIARLRTILFYQTGDWVSLASPTPGSRIEIGWASTAVAVIASLRGLSALDQQNLVGKVKAGGLTFDSTGTVLGTSEFSTVFGLVDQALKGDQDPVAVIGYDASAAAPASQYGMRLDNLAIHPSFSPARATLGGTVTFNGHNFPSPNSEVSVTIGNLPVAHWTTNTDRTQLMATIPAAGRGGALGITRGKSTWFGPFVPVSGTVGTFAGAGFAGLADGQGPMAMFSQPLDLVCDAQGMLYVTDAGSNRIRKISPSGAVTTLAGSGGGGSLDGTGTAATFSSPHGIAIDSGGNLYVSDYGTHKIRKVTPSGVVTTIAGTGAPGFVNGLGTGASLSYPTGVAVDAAGNVYVADGANHAIRKIDPAGNVTTYAGTGTPGLNNGPRATATFNVPQGVATDTAGNLYVSDETNNVIRKIDAAGNVTTLSSTPLVGPFGLKADSGGNVYVASRSGHMIHRVAPNGNVSVVAGSAMGYNDGPTAGALLNQPHGVALDAAGNLFVTDRYNHRIRVVSP